MKKNGKKENEARAAGGRTARPRLFRLTATALAAVIIAVCSWITVPGVIPFTLQTMGVFFVLGLLGGIDGTAAVAVYILLGLAGVPVFSGFRAGPGHLMGATGGYIIGFLLSGLLYFLLSAVKKPSSLPLKIIYMLVGLAVCYLFGTLWFSYVWSGASGDFAGALSVCVVPFIIPDIVKLILAGILSDRVGRALDKSGLRA